MLTLNAIELLNLLQAILGTEVLARGEKGALPSGVIASIKEGASNIQRFAKELELPVTEATAKNMLAGCTTVRDLHEALVQLGNTLFMELDNRKFYGPIQKYTQYYDQPSLFGAEVFSNFPSANNDIYEAGMCLALERPTACVMHLMRVAECGLYALAETVKVKKQNDWGAYLREIEKELDRRAKEAGARTADEQFYAESGANFHRMRVAWRNPTMHPDKTYSLERAEEILMAVKSFMGHLPPRISEIKEHENKN